MGAQNAFRQMTKEGQGPILNNVPGDAGECLRAPFLEGRLILVPTDGQEKSTLSICMGRRKNHYERKRG